MKVEEIDIACIPGKHRNVKLSQVWDMENLIAAEKEARRGKAGKYGVRKFDRNPVGNLLDIQRMLKEDVPSITGKGRGAVLSLR